MRSRQVHLDDLGPSPAVADALTALRARGDDEQDAEGVRRDPRQQVDGARKRALDCSHWREGIAAAHHDLDARDTLAWGLAVPEVLEEAVVTEPPDHVDHEHPQRGPDQRAVRLLRAGEDVDPEQHDDDDAVVEQARDDADRQAAGLGARGSVDVFLRLAAEAGTPTQIAEACVATYRAAIEAGYGDQIANAIVAAMNGGVPLAPR